MVLYHFTCMRAAKLIVEQGYLMPKPQPELGMLPVVWLASLRERDSQQMRRLGLTWHTGRLDCENENPPCNPLAARFGVLLEEHHTFIPFSTLMKDHPGGEEFYRSLPGAHAGRWFASLAPVRLYLMDRIPRRKTADV